MTRRRGDLLFDLARGGLGVTRDAGTTELEEELAATW